MGWRINRIFRKLLIVVVVFAMIILAIAIYLTINYPIGYQKAIGKYSKEFNIDPYLIAAIINVESRYDKDAISHREARGLMQISPSTGLWGAEALSIQDFELEMLFKPEINIMFGAWYLNVLSSEFNDNLQLILAAYNGGSGNVRKWLKDSNYSDDGIRLKRIPFEETKDYIQRVLQNHDIYRILYKGEFSNPSTKKETQFIIVIHNFRRLFRYIIKYK